MKNTELLIGAALGAGIMYMLDPERGARRRGLVRDQAAHLGREIDDNVTDTARDLRNRARGAVAETRARLTEDQVSGSVLEERVRSQMGRAVSNAGSIEVRADDAGHVTLSGPVRDSEVDDLIDRVRSVRGVEEVDVRREARSDRGEVPGRRA